MPQLQKLKKKYEKTQKHIKHGGDKSCEVNLEIGNLKKHENT